jgi:putative holliday junction resolvase
LVSGFVKGIMAAGRALGIDVGERRVGLAVSDATQTLARPLATLAVRGINDAAKRVKLEIDRLTAENDDLVTIVVGLPSTLDGLPTNQTARVEAFIGMLAAKTSLPIVRVDERLTSREAESRLAQTERDWRRRKERLDAAAAAIILQDYLDQRRVL